MKPDLPSDWLQDDAPAAPPPPKRAAPTPAPPPKRPVKKKTAFTILGTPYVEADAFLDCTDARGHHLKPFMDDIRRCTRCKAFRGPGCWFERENAWLDDTINKALYWAIGIIAALLFIGLIASANG